MIIAKKGPVILPDQRAQDLIEARALLLKLKQAGVIRWDATL